MRAPNCLSPQVLGLVPYLLSESCIFRSANETEAIVSLLQQVSSRRQFYLVLERMHPIAQVVSAVDSLKRIRSYLSGLQARDFSNFIKHLVSRAGEAVPGQPLSQWWPWQLMHVNDKPVLDEYYAPGRGFDMTTVFSVSATFVHPHQP